MTNSISLLTHLQGPLAAFTFPQFRRVWVAAVVLSLGNWGERLAAGWLVLNETDSVFLVAATFAVRQAPQLIAAPIGGALADRFSRGNILFVSGVYRLLVLSILAYVAANGLDPLWPLFLLLSLSGVGHSFEIPAVQGMITGSVPREVRMNAVSVHSTGVRTIGAIGAFASGFAVHSFGVPTTIVASGVVFTAGGALAIFADRSLRFAVATEGASVFEDIFQGFAFMARMPVVRSLLVTAMFVEIFGFAFGAVMPAVAKHALGVDVKGLGTLTMMAGIGSVIGSVVLMSLGDFGRKGMLLIIIALFYGLFIATFSASGSYLIALILIIGVGASAAAFDAMQWTLLQLNVPESMRGRAIGAWVFAIGFGWVGHLGLGALGELFGVQWALAGAGIMVSVTGLIALFTAPKLRRA